MATWELYFCNFQHNFICGIRSIHEKKLEAKNLVQLSLSGRFMVSREVDSSKYIFGWFLKSSWAEEKELESRGTGRRLQKIAELRSQILKVRNRSSAFFFSPQLRNRFGCPQYCGVGDLNCGCPLLVICIRRNTGSYYCVLYSVQTTPHNIVNSPSRPHNQDWLLIETWAPAHLFIHIDTEID